MDTVVVCHTQRALTTTTSFRAGRPPLSVPLPLPSSADEIIVAIFHGELTHVGGCRRRPGASQSSHAMCQVCARCDKVLISGGLDFHGSVSCYDAQATFYLISASSRFIEVWIFPDFFPGGCKGPIEFTDRPMLSESVPRVTSLDCLVFFPLSQSCLMV